MRLLILATLLASSCASHWPCRDLIEPAKTECLYDYRVTNPYYDKGKR